MGKVNAKKIILIVVSIIAIILAIICIKTIINNITINKQMKSAKHAITLTNNVELYSSTKTKKSINTLAQGTNTYILESDTDKAGNKLYKVKAGKQVGYVQADKIGYYTQSKMKKVRMVDVSQFNMQNNFTSIEHFKAFLINNNIQYVYVRAGGRGYGQAGNFYYDTNYKDYAEACEYLKIPFGFYFLDEAITSEEVNEEVEFIDEFLKENNYHYNKLPVALDVEKHIEKGRADEIWDTRYNLVNELITKLNKKDIKSILYSNASIANEYLTNVNSKMWLAYYPNISEEPSYWFSSTDAEGASNKELISKMVAWQFSDKGIPNTISEKVDISIVYNEFFTSGTTNEMKSDLLGTNYKALKVIELKNKRKIVDVFTIGR